MNSLIVYPYRPLDSSSESTSLIDNTFDPYPFKQVWGRIFSFIKDSQVLQAVASTDKVFGSIVREIIFAKHKKCLYLKKMIWSKKIYNLFHYFPLNNNPFKMHSDMEKVLGYFSDLFDHTEKERELLKRCINEHPLLKIDMEQLTNPKYPQFHALRTLYQDVCQLCDLLDKPLGKDIDLIEKVLSKKENYILFKTLVENNRVTIISELLNSESIKKSFDSINFKEVSKRVLFNNSEKEESSLKTIKQQMKANALSIQIAGLVFAMFYAIFPMNIFKAFDKQTEGYIITPFACFFIYMAFDLFAFFRNQEYSYTLSRLLSKAPKLCNIEPNFNNMV